MEHHMEQAQAWGSYLTDLSFSQQAQLLSSQRGIEPNESQLDHAGASREVPGGRKRRGCKPTQTPEEKRQKKNEADRNYRKNLKGEFDKLKAIASRFGGVEKMEHGINEMEAELLRLRRIVQRFHVIQPIVTEFHRFNQIKAKFNGIEDMESKFQRLEQITSIFGGFDEMVTEIIRLKNIELQYIEYEQMVSRLDYQKAQPIIAFPQEQGYHGMQFVNFNNQGQGSQIDRLEDYEISEMFPAAMSGTMPDLVYSDAHVTEFNAKLAENVMSNVCLSGFNDLLGECQTLGGYTFSQSLDSNANDIFIDHSDVTRYDNRIVEKWIPGLMAEEKSLKGELENMVNEVNAMNAQENRVNNLSCADDFLNRTGCPF